jgi:hypothetical protein
LINAAVWNSAKGDAGLEPTHWPIENRTFQVVASILDGPEWSLLTLRVRVPYPKRFNAFFGKSGNMVSDPISAIISGVVFAIIKTPLFLFTQVLQ